MCKIPITNDLFDIADRLKSINPAYRLVFNTQTQNYEVYNAARGNELAFVVPYKELDERTLRYARFSSVQNAEAVFEEIERNNSELERRHRYELKEKLLQAADEALNG